ncbi:hypothetical protein [Flavobacterium sp. FlaQc-30]|uniref:hypothetical protein n=1 Tax=Flavobacterium sp. FlaQc-30 TaxID=3374179 RepID=UPI003756AA4E
MQPMLKNIFKGIRLFLAMGTMIGVLYLMALKSSNNRLREIAYIKSDFGTAKAVVTAKKTYRGNSLSVEYYVNGIFYEAKDSFDDKYQDAFNEGDSITIKYSAKKPELIINEFNATY